MRKTLSSIQQVFDNIQENSVNFTLKIVGKALGQEVVLKPAAAKISAKNNTNIAGSTVLWFWQDGIKHFVLVKNKDPKSANNLKGSLRFPSFYGLLDGKDATTTMRLSLKYQFGETFFQKLDMYQISFASVAAAPTFYWKNETTSQEETVQMMVWQQEIDPRWLKKIKVAKNMVVQSVPEFAMGGKRISTAHNMIFKNLNRAMSELEEVERLAHNLPAGLPVMGDDILIADADAHYAVEDMMEEVLELALPFPSKVLH